MGSGQFDKAGVLAADFSGLEAASPGFTVRLPHIILPISSIVFWWWS
jgi:profilin